MRFGIWIAATAGLAGWLLTSSLYMVDETQEALLIRLGKPVGIETAPGLKVKLPFVDTVVLYDKRLMPLEPPAEQIILGDQKRLEVETYTRFRIRDPLLYHQTLRTLEQARSQLSQIVSSSLRRELGQVSLPVLLSEGRAAVTDRIRREVTEKSDTLGLEVVDVRLRRADLPAETSQAIYDRMKSEREREAKELRAQGFEWEQLIKSKADRERTVLLSEAQRQSRITRGEADAEANRQFADVVGNDPEFYKLYRSLQTYRQSLSDAAPTLVLTPETDFLQFFRSGPPR